MTRPKLSSLSILIVLALFASAASSTSQPNANSLNARENSSPQVSQKAISRASVKDSAPPIPPVLIKSKTSEPQTDQDHSSVNTNKETTYTGLLVIVGTLAIVVAGFQYWAANSSAKAAEKGANAAIAASAAHLHLMRVRLGDRQDRDLMADAVGVIDPILHYGFTNYGKSPAFLQEMCWETINAPHLPETPVYKNRGPVGGLFVIAGEQDIDHGFKWSHLFGKYLTEQEIEPVRKKENKLYVFGFFKFSDVFDRTSSVGFAYHIDAKGTAHVVAPDIAPGYWYRRLEQLPSWWVRFLRRSSS